MTREVLKLFHIPWLGWYASTQQSEEHHDNFTESQRSLVDQRYAHEFNNLERKGDKQHTQIALLGQYSTVAVHMRKGTRAFRWIGKSSNFFLYHNLFDMLLPNRAKNIMTTARKANGVWQMNAMPTNSITSKKKGNKPHTQIALLVEYSTVSVHPCEASIENNGDRSSQWYPQWTEVFPRVSSSQMDDRGTPQRVAYHKADCQQ